jgi:hypothetical protein
LVRAYPLIAVSKDGVPVIPPSAITKVYEALVGDAMFSDNLAPASKVILPVVVATTVGTVGAGIVTLGVIT